ncbi:MAG: Gfo/Idh/MocA family oxidoreductase [Clostridium sp.]
MKIAVIGLGSMGKRRLRLLKTNFENVSICGIDLDEERRTLVENEFNVPTFKSIDDAIKNNGIEAVVISTSPLSHANIIMECLEKNLHVFTEINLVDSRYDEIISLAKEKDRVLFLSSTQLYRKEIEVIDERVAKQQTRVNYTYHIGQYLPDWHPWESYKNFFVNDKRTNGCRELFTIELPWIIKVFGKIKKVTTVKDKISTLDLSYDDTYMCIFEHENGNKGVMCVDVVARRGVTNLEIYGEGMHVEWAGTPDSLMALDLETKSFDNIATYEDIEKDGRYAQNIIENPYLEELKVYVDKINGNDRVKYTFEDDIETLRLIDEIEGN